MTTPSDYGAALAKPASTGSADRECTCHPDDNRPRPCPQKFAYSECVKAHSERNDPLSPEEGQVLTRALMDGWTHTGITRLGLQELAKESGK